MTDRYRIDVLGDIHAVERRIASNRKTTATTLNPVSAKVADATHGSLVKRLDALRAELETAAERPPVTYGGMSFRFNERTTPMSEAESLSLEIPDFLRREPQMTEAGRGIDQ